MGFKYNSFRTKGTHIQHHKYNGLNTITPQIQQLKYPNLARTRAYIEQPKLAMLAHTSKSRSRQKDYQELEGIRLKQCTKTTTKPIQIVW